MKIQNSPSFCGKTICPPEVTGMGHLLTDAVKYRIRFAPKGTTLHFKDGTFLNFGKVELIAPTGDKLTLSGPKFAIREQRVLDLIKTGVKSFTS